MHFPLPRVLLVVGGPFILGPILWILLSGSFKYASVADSTAFLIMLHSSCPGPFSGGIACIGVLDFGPRKKIHRI